MSSLFARFYRFSGEVHSAITSSQSSSGSRLVLLESAILSHGLPYPQNLEMAHSVQNIIREKVQKN